MELGAPPNGPADSFRPRRSRDQAVALSTRASSEDRCVPEPPGSDAHRRNDETLMAAIRVGDASAFQTLLDRYWSPLLSYGVAITGNTDTAEDLTQEAFARLWERRGSWEAGVSGSSVRNYLYRLVRNLAIDDLRKVTVRQRWAALVRREQVRGPPTPIQLLEGEDLRTEINKAVGMLTPRRREVFCLVHVHGMSYKQAASLMGISSQTVANQMSTALAELRRLLGPLLA